MSQAPSTQPTLAVTLAGEAMALDPAGALIWPTRWTAFVADTHFGKGATFRRGGIPVPAGASDDDLTRLSALIERHAIQHLVVLGDFFHAPPVAGDPFVEAFAAWRRRHDALALTVIRGNHDRPAGDALASLIDWQPEGLDWPPFRLHHEPVAHADGHVLAGHEHPAAKLAAGGDRLRVPVFRLSPGLTVLPAFGGLTGGYAAEPVAGERRVAVTPAGLYELP